MTTTPTNQENNSQEQHKPTDNTIILAGATGDLGMRVAHYLIKRGAKVKALVRKKSAVEKVTALQKMGVNIEEVDFNDTEKLIQACRGGTCFVSALSGLRNEIVDLQTILLYAAVEAAIPRFIPSDYCIDYTKLAYGTNRNLDLRREFNEILDKAPIKATSILNGMFTDLLTGEAPVILTGIKKIFYWGNADQLMDFTTTDNTAAYTAAAALDSNTTRYLRIAGEVASMKDLRKTASEVSGNEYGVLRPGGLGAFGLMIKFTRLVAPQKGEVFPAWQGMQYMHNMLSGKLKLESLDNNRYHEIRWTSIKEVLKRGLSEKDN